MHTLILGIGNLLLADEGVGVHVVRRLQGQELPADTELLEVGTAILDALPALERAERLILIDAMKGGSPPGTVYRRDLAECGCNTQIASMHGFDLKRTLALVREPRLKVAVVIGVEPLKIEWGLELSKEVAAAVDGLVAAILAEL